MTPRNQADLLLGKESNLCVPPAIRERKFERLWYDSRSIISKERIDASISVPVEPGNLTAIHGPAPTCSQRIAIP